MGRILIIQRISRQQQNKENLAIPLIDENILIKLEMRKN
mgnify:CR=1 FL=1